MYVDSPAICSKFGPLVKGMPIITLAARQNLSGIPYGCSSMLRHRAVIRVRFEDACATQSLECRCSSLF